MNIRLFARLLYLGMDHCQSMGPKGYIYIALVIFILLPAACRPGRPGISLPEVPAHDLVSALEKRERAFSTLSAVASVQGERKGRRRSFETTGILLDDGKRLKIEAYGPMGDPLVTILWTDQAPVVRVAGQVNAVNMGIGMERVLGIDIDKEELSAILSGNIPSKAFSSRSRAFCGPAECIVEFFGKDDVRHMHLIASTLLPAVYDVYNGSSLVLRARFENYETVSGYPMPMRVIIESPSKKALLTIDYADVAINSALADDAFTMPGEGFVQ